MWFMFALTFWIGFAILTIIRRDLRKKWGSVDKANEISVKGKTVIITGANSGIGLGTALEFAYRDATVILACRDLEKAKNAVHWIRSYTPLGELICMELDLASFHSIRKFCKEFKMKYDRLDILCNNAGVMMPPGLHQKTEDGYEIHMGVNHLGHFLLTNLLIESLKKAVPSRVVTVSSMGHSMGSIDFDDFFYEKKEVQEFGITLLLHNDLYANSKLANALFSKELAKRLQGTGIGCHALCTGPAVTPMGRNIKGPMMWILILFSPILRYLLKTPVEGAQTTIYCSLSKDLINETGKMYVSCGEWPESDRIALKDEDARKLWEVSEKLVNL